MLSDKVIPPGGEGDIKVTLNTKGKQNKIEKDVTVITNVPGQEQIKLKISADIVVLFGFEPRSLQFGKVLPGETATKTLTGVGEKLQDVEIKSVEIQDTEHASYYDIKVEDTGKGTGRKIMLSITTKDIPAGYFRDRIKVTTNIEKQEFDIYLSGEMLGLIEILPRSLIVRSKSEDEPSTGSITVKPTKGDKFKILEAVCEDPRPKVAVMEPAEDGSVEIQMTIPAEFGEERFRSKLTIKTDLKDQPVIEVPVYLFTFRSSSRIPSQPMSGKEEVPVSKIMKGPPKKIDARKMKDAVPVK